MIQLFPSFLDITSIKNCLSNNMKIRCPVYANETHLLDMMFPLIEKAHLWRKHCSLLPLLGINFRFSRCCWCGLNKINFKLSIRETGFLIRYIFANISATQFAIFRISLFIRLHVSRDDQTHISHIRRSQKVTSTKICKKNSFIHTDVHSQFLFQDRLKYES